MNCLAEYWVGCLNKLIIRTMKFIQRQFGTSVCRCDICNRCVLCKKALGLLISEVQDSFCINDRLNTRKQV